MKKILLSLVAMVIATVSFAQSSLLATLSHDGTISTFYGSTAFKDAMEKAVDGDAITLSAGQFQAANITKAITLRGAGMSISNDSITSHESTIIQGDLELSIADGTSERLMVEGIYFSAKVTYTGKVNNALFMKSRFQNFRNGTDGVLTNATFIHCRVANSIDLSDSSNANMINCVVWSPFNNKTTGSNFQFHNCVIQFTKYSNDYAAGRVINSYYKNCAIMVGCSAGYYYNESTVIPSSNVVVNCVGCSNYGSISGYDNDIFYYINSKTSTNTNVASPSSIFKTGGFSYTDEEAFELTDEAKKKYLGSDGKEVGIYGGSLPYEETPTTPQITKCNVAAKSTADGKLSVDVEVKAAE